MLKPIMGLDERMPLTNAQYVKVTKLFSPFLSNPIVLLEAYLLFFSWFGIKQSA